MGLIIIPTAWCCGRTETVIHELGALEAAIMVGCGISCLEVPVGAASVPRLLSVPSILGLPGKQTDRRQHSLRLECACVQVELIREADPGIHSTHLPNPKWKQIQMLFINKDSVLKREQTHKPV